MGGWVGGWVDGKREERREKERDKEPPTHPSTHVRFFILKGDVAGKDMTVLELAGHIRVASTVIHHQAAHKPAVGAEFVRHVHDFHHVQVDGLD